MRVSLDVFDVRLDRLGSSSRTLQMQPTAKSGGSFARLLAAG